jgi:hypothetical protein
MRKLMVVMMMIASVVCMGQDAKPMTEMEKLQKALQDAPMVKLEEQNINAYAKTAAIAIVEKGTTAQAEYNQAKLDIVAKEAKIKSIYNNLGASTKRKNSGMSKGDTDAQPLKNDISELNVKMRNAEWTIKNAKAEYQNLRLKHIDFLNGKIAELKANMSQVAN